MYFRILKKDLKRKKTMNIILLLFLILATMFISSSMNNIISISTALDRYFEKANVPDYWIILSEDREKERFEEFAKEGNYSYQKEDIVSLNLGNVKVNDNKLDYSNVFWVSDVSASIITVFDNKDQPVTEVKSGEIYMTAEIMNRFDLEVGDSLSIQDREEKETFRIAGITKDALFGSSMMGQTRCLMNHNDFEKVKKGKEIYSYGMYGVYEEDIESFESQYIAEGINSVFNEKRNIIQTMYIMDMVIAGVLLIVSVCLIIIFLVILRFTIVYTVQEEIREIGVMKAIGIKNGRIRGLYAAKYFVIALVGGIFGLFLGIPFGEMMMSNASQNIMLDNRSNHFINLISTIVTLGLVLLITYGITRKINRFTPVVAIRRGSTGERFKRKAVLRLGRGHMKPVFFMAMNDILCSMRKHAILILAFTLGNLLIIIPANTANTLKSDQLITWFSAVESDWYVDFDSILDNKIGNEQDVDTMLSEEKERIRSEGIPVNVHMECLFKVNASRGDKKCKSLAFQGRGDVTASEYTYLEGTSPRMTNEVAISHVIADKINADIGDTITIGLGEKEKKYIVTALFQTMNNMGEGIRFSERETLDYSYLMGNFAAQIRYEDDPDEEERERRKNVIKGIYQDVAAVYSGGEYIDSMLGGLSGDIDNITYLILLVVFCINILVTVLMMKTFITKERGEIGMLKAIGFQNRTLILWQTLRIGIVMVISILLAIVFSTPLTKFSSGQIFQLMGAQSIHFEIRPWQVYVGYPLLTLAVTLLAGFLTAQTLRFIKTSETSNIE